VKYGTQRLRLQAGRWKRRFLALPHARWWLAGGAAVAISYGVLLGYMLFVSHDAKLLSHSGQSTSTAKSENNGATAGTTDGSGADNGTGGTAPAPAPNTPQPPTVPAGVLHLNSWKLTLPISTSKDGSPDEITQPRLDSFVLSPYFQLTPDHTGVQFRAPVGGVTTSGSKYPRSELREMTAGGATPASWSNAAQTHTMTIRQAITHVPAVRPQLVAGQIHDAKDYVILIRLEGVHLFVEADGNNVGTLDDNYRLGTVFTVQVVAGDGHIRVSYNGVVKADYVKSGSGYYFKAGCYTQSNPSKGDAPDDYGQVVVYGLDVT
jgi:hypothetical protein